MADDFRSMQEDAIRRVREMQRRSQTIVGNTPQVQTQMETQTPETPADNAEQIQQDEQTHEAAQSKELFNIGGIKIDEEKALIALLIYILYKNKADTKLLLGLGYLLL